MWPAIFWNSLWHKALGGPEKAVLLPPERREKEKDGDG